MYDYRRLSGDLSISCGIMKLVVRWGQKPSSSLQPGFYSAPWKLFIDDTSWKECQKLSAGTKVVICKKIKKGLWNDVPACLNFVIAASTNRNGASRSSKPEKVVNLELVPMLGAG